MSDSKKVFILNAPEDIRFLQSLEAQLAILQRDGVIQSWDKSKLIAGANLKEEIEKNLKASDIVLLLISADYLAQEWCNNIQNKAIELNKYLIPIILRPCLWETNKALSNLEVKPIKDGKVKPVSSWNKADEAFENVARSILNAVNNLNAASTPPQPPDYTRFDTKVIEDEIKSCESQREGLIKSRSGLISKINKLTQAINDANPMNVLGIDALETQKNNLEEKLEDTTKRIERINTKIKELKSQL